jgi:hypothetical protein
VTFKRAWLAGLRVTFPDGQVIDILPDEVDEQSANEPLVLDSELMNEALAELFEEGQ